MRILRHLAALLGAASISLGPALVATPAAAAAIEPYCPNGCVGSRVEDTNCNLDAYGIASVVVTEPMQVNRFRNYLWYSPMCKTFWGDYLQATGGYPRTSQVWTQDQYGGREVLAAWVNSEEGQLHYLTTMVSAAGSAKFCVIFGTDAKEDPVTLDESQWDSNWCTDWR